MTKIKMLASVSEALGYIKAAGYNEYIIESLAEVIDQLRHEVLCEVNVQESAEHDGCKDCRYEECEEDERPCVLCRNTHDDYWQPKKAKLEEVNKSIKANEATENHNHDCENCKYFSLHNYEAPCSRCICADEYLPYWVAKEKEE